jgi:hypothetical protein
LNWKTESRGPMRHCETQQILQEGSSDGCLTIN